MQRYVVDLRLTRDQVLRMYQGSVNALVGQARNGQRIRFPLRTPRQFVDSEAVNGTFQLAVALEHRLVSIERLSKLRSGA